VSLFSSPYHAVLVLKVCAICAALFRLRPAAVFESVTTALRCAVLVPVLGNPARITEPTTSHNFSFFDSSVDFVQDVFGVYWPA
jgi:hypothetical protein